MIKFVIGDIHLGCDIIFKNVHSYNFDTMDEYIETLIDNYNSVVLKEDTVLFLGDIGTKLEVVKKYLPKFNGRKILILGNHDKFGLEFYQKYFDKVYEHPLYYNDRLIFSHSPVKVEDGIVNIHGHTHHIYLDSKLHYNFCVEHTMYHPVGKNDCLMMLDGIEEPRRDFLNEWYRDIQIWDGPVVDNLVLDDNNKIIRDKTIELQKKTKRK